MTTASLHFEQPEARSSLRWIAGAAFTLALHAGIAATVLYWPQEMDASSDTAGAIMIDLGGDATSTSLERGEDATTKEAEEPEPEPEEPTPQPIEETAPVEEAPLVPQPAVELPKEVEKKEVEKPVEKKEKVEKPSPKSDNKQKQTAMGGAKGSSKPSALFKGHPAYPQSAKSKGIKSGRVTVRYTITPSGSVSGVSVVSSTPPGVFDSATVSAVSKWRFTATGSSSSQTQTVHFKLK